MSNRTVNDGTTAGQTGRFTVGQPDGLNDPVGGFNAGRPPFVWMTGGGTAANINPNKIGMDVKLDYLCDVKGWSIGQPNVPLLLGNDLSMQRIRDCVAWLRANRGATMDPPILMGVSVGWFCSIIWARQFDVTAVVGMLTPCGDAAAYLATPPGSPGDGFGFVEATEDAWDVTWPALPPDRWSPWDDVANYPTSIHGKVLMQYSCCDPIAVPTQMSFGAQIRAKMHNIGATGHLGAFNLTELNTTEPIDACSEVLISDHIDSLWP